MEYIPVPSLGTFTTRCFPGGDPQNFVGHSHRPFHPQLLFLGRVDQVGADLFQRPHVAGSQRDPDAMDQGYFLSGFLGVEFFGCLKFNALNSNKLSGSGLRTIFAYILVEMVAKNYFTSAEPESTQTLHSSIHSKRTSTRKANLRLTF